jgi:4-amino-4-deoxy-L-arabinose transferase-like glycosyltransferase
MNRKTQLAVVAGVLAAVGAFVLVVSQCAYSYGDEGWYLLAAQLVNSGERPYLDFFYQHPPLDLYFTAGWMRLFGETWRSVHAMSAVFLALSTILIGIYVFTRFENRSWKGVLAASVALLFGCNIGLKMAVLSASYALSIFLVFSAFLLTLRAANKPGFFAFWPGLFAGLAVATSLLNGAIAPILLIWLAIQLPRGARVKPCSYYLAGVLIAVLPVGWFALHAWRQELFDVVTFHLKYRTLGPKFWRDKNVLFEDLKIYASMLNSTQGLLLIVYALIGFAYVISPKDGNPRFRKELQLCALIVVCLGAYICLARASCSQYFLAVLPFLVILATVGLFAVGTRVCPGLPAVWVVLAMLGMYEFEAAKSWREQIFKPERTWTEDERIGQLINRVIPPGAPIYCNDGAVYAAARRIPPRGLENNYAFVLPPKVAATVNVLAQPVIDALVAERKFVAVVAWSKEETESLHLRELYKEHQVFPTHEMFWDLAETPPQQVTARF